MSAWGRMDTTERTAVMDEEQIRAIVESCGYTMYTNDHISSKGNGKVTTYVYAMKGTAKWYLGNMRTVEAMSEEQLRRK
jgi:hypothetical protein